MQNSFCVRVKKPNNKKKNPEQMLHYLILLHCYNSAVVKFEIKNL